METVRSTERQRNIIPWGENTSHSVPGVMRHNTCGAFESSSDVDETGGGRQPFAIEDRGPGVGENTRRVLPGRGE